MDPLVVVTYPMPLRIEARPVPHEHTPEGAVALGYYHRDHLIARGVVAGDTLEAINSILRKPVSVALAATEDEEGNIDGRVCLLLQLDAEELADDPEEGPEEPWKASVPTPPGELGGEDEGETSDGQPQMVLLPLGNVVRSASNRSHPDDVSADAREMLANLLAGKGQDAVSRAIDDLLDSI